MLSEKSRTLSIGEALDMGVGHAMAGNHKSAISMFKGVLIHEPENFEAINRLGSSLFEEKDYYEALYWFWRGRKIDRRHPMALTNYGLCLAQLGHTEEGLPALQTAVHLAEKSSLLSNEAKALIYNNLGNSYERLSRYEEALVALDKGIAYNRNDSFPHYNRGIVLLRLRRPQEAIAALTRALELDPGNADAHYNQGMGHLLLGNFKDGFADYEWRHLTSENVTPNLGLPPDKKWTGTEDLAGKTILIRAEQGLGDTIQFLRFVPDIQKRAAKVLLIVHSALRDMARASFPSVLVLDPKEDLEGRYDRWAALMSLPMCLGIEHENEIPPPWEYEPEPERIVRWGNDLKLPNETLNIGVCWAGNFRHKNDKHRSIPLEKFASLFSAPNCTFVSLQQMEQRDTEVFPKIKGKYPNLTALWLDDMRDTAAVISNLDLVISADTAVAHMAATLSVPTWILIPKMGTDWRWMLNREDSPWYPSAKLIRQDKIGDWMPTLSRIRADLGAKTALRAA